MLGYGPGLLLLLLHSWSRICHGDPQVVALLMISKLELRAHCICHICPYFCFLACSSNDAKKSSDLMSMFQGKSGISLSSLKSSQR